MTDQYFKLLSENETLATTLMSKPISLSNDNVNDMFWMSRQTVTVLITLQMQRSLALDLIFESSVCQIFRRLKK